jgi:hypothetical protein
MTFLPYFIDLITARRLIMNRLLIIAFVAVSMFSPRLARCEIMTAVCEEPKGYTVVFKDNRFDSSPDRIEGATLSYSWDTDTRKATIITQHSRLAGGEPISYPAQVIPVSKGHISFLVVFDKGIELHSLFLDQKTVYFSSQKDLSDTISSGKIFAAKCKMGVN